MVSILQLRKMPDNLVNLLASLQVSQLDAKYKIKIQVNSCNGQTFSAHIQNKIISNKENAKDDIIYLLIS